MRQKLYTGGGKKEKKSRIVDYLSVLLMLISCTTWTGSTLNPIVDQRTNPNLIKHSRSHWDPLDPSPVSELPVQSDLFSLGQFSITKGEGVQKQPRSWF